MIHDPSWPTEAPRQLITVLFNKVRSAHAAAQEFLELAHMPAVGDCVATSDGWHRVTMVCHLSNPVDVDAMLFGTPVELGKAFETEASR
jgi:hypothetical protein